MHRDKPTFLFLGFVFLFIAGNLFAQDFKTVRDGIEYAEVTRKLGEDPVKINLLRLDLTKVRLDVHHAMDAAIGTEKTSSIATRHGAIAAINAGFFRLDKSRFAGDSIGLLMVDGELVSESSNHRITLVIANAKKRTNALIRGFNSSTVIRFGFTSQDEDIDVLGINRERKSDDLVLYTPHFGFTTLTDNTGTELIISGCKLAYFKDNRRMKVCSNIEIGNGEGNNRIPTNGFVISFAPKTFSKGSDVLKEITRFRLWPKNPRKLFLYSVVGRDDDILVQDMATDIVAGVPQLIKNGKIDITWEQEKASRSFVETRHPRTAVAKLKDGKFLMMTVDGRQAGVSVGMNLYELADYLLSLGAVDAMNLDGGGSTTMVLDGKVVNKPSDKEGERKVGDAILVTLRNKKSLPKKLKSKK